MAGPAGRVKAVLVCGGRWHDFDFARLHLLERLGRHERVRTRVFEDYARIDAIESADLLVTYTCDVRPSREQQRVLVDFVARGGRWLALHATNAAIEAPTPGGERLFTTPRVFGAVAALLGSQFLGHPPIAPYQVEITQPDHPLVAGIGPFQVSDELYVSELHPPIDVLLHTRYRGPSRGFAEGQVPASADARQPVLYLRRHAAGEVCYLTLGHCRGRFDVQDLGVDDLGHSDRGSWTVPEFITVLDRCLSRAVYGTEHGAG
ncbi:MULTISPECIES: ThuA domain-containing protein [unclassified Frankia]|uniref:ThuA domain-containing protein n=1 Tax=unclassified Frankia TaxID=2632575 RepID=UPI001EF3D9AE|nr:MULTISPECIES: ThuA domain-containing protein [unclassified Frankia]